MSTHGELTFEFTIAEDFDAIDPAIGQAGAAQSLFVDPRAFIEAVEGLEVDRQITRFVPRIIEPALGDAPDQRHLTAFETNANGTARAGRLTFASAAAGFAVSAGFALSEAFAPVLGTGPRF